jgi:translocation and assembly module TamB
MLWKRKLGWIAGIVIAFVLVAALVGFLVLRSQWLQGYLRGKIEQTASESLGGQVRIQNFVFHLSNLTADAYGITVRGNEPQTAPPLLQADQLEINLKIVSLLHRKVDLKEIILRHPVVNFVVQKDGTNNLPSPPKKNTSSSTNVFDLGIQHVLLSNGEIYYNDVKTPLDADLHELQLEVRAPFASKNYDGSLSYRDGHVKYGTLRPLPHELNATFSATPDDFQLKPLLLKVASSSVQINGKVQNFANLSANGTYRITVFPQEFRRVLNNPTLPTGEIVLAGSLRYQYSANEPMLRTVVMDGDLNSRELAVNSPQVRTLVRNLRGQFRLANGNFDARGVEAELLGGRVVLAAAVQHVDTTPAARVHAALQGISIGSAKSALRAANLNQIPIEGHVDGTADASWAGSINNLRAHSDIGLKAALTNASSGTAPVPLNGAVHLTYANSIATLANSYLATPRTRVDFNGSAGQRLNLTLRAHAADLRELDSLAAALQSGSQAQTANNKPRSLNLAGTADANILVQGDKNNPQIQGRLRSQNLQLQNTRWRSLQVDLAASKSGVSLRNGSVVNARQGYVNFSLTAGLANWHYQPSSPINVQLTSRGLAINQLLQVANLNYPVSGNLAADVSVQGSQLNPIGKGSIRLAQANIYGQPLQNLSLQFTGNGNAVNSQFVASMPAGSINAKAILYPKTKGYDVQFSVPGINLSQLQLVQERNVPLQGTLTASANGRGTFDNPQLNAVVQIPQLQIRQASVSGIKAQLNLANQKAQLALDSEVARSFIQARGTVNLRDGYYTQATFDTRAIPLEGLLALYMPVKTNGPRGELELHASVQGPLKEKNHLQAQVTIPTLTANYQGLQIGNKGPIRARYANSTVVLEPSEIAGTDTDLRFQGQLPLQGNAPVTLAANGAINMQLLQFFQADLKSSGKVLLDVRGTRIAGRPSVQGQIRIENVGIMPPDAPLGIENLNGVLDVHNDQITISQLTGQSGGGQLSATGVIGYRPQLQTNVNLNAKSVRIRYQDAVRVVLDSSLSLVGTTQSSSLNGRVIIDSLGFTQNFDLAGLASTFQTGSESAPSTGDSFADHLKLNVAVQSSRDLNLASSALNIQGQANLRLVGTATDPVIVGRTEFTGGEIFLMNNRYQIQRGIIQFTNPNHTEPVLNVLLTTTINQFNLSLNFIGPLDKLRTNYVSDPPLPTADIINLIARGQTTEQAASSPSNLGASSLLAQGVASQVSSGIQKLAGLSSLSIDPTLGGNDPNPGARIALQKRVTKNFFFTFATDVTSTQREIIQGEYQLTKRWSTSVTRDENGGISIDGKFHTTF